MSVLGFFSLLMVGIFDIWTQEMQFHLYLIGVSRPPFLLLPINPNLDIKRNK